MTFHCNFILVTPLKNREFKDKQHYSTRFLNVLMNVVSVATVQFPCVIYWANTFFYTAYILQLLTAQNKMDK